MIHVSILLLHHVNVGGLENARQGFLEANNYLISQEGLPKFNVELVGLGPTIDVDNGRYTINAHKEVGEVAKTDIIVIPPVQQNIAEALELNQGFCPWIMSQYHQGAQVASLCVGAFILGSTGLLDGRNCVTHWRSECDFKKLFPNINLVTDKLLTDDQGIYTGGGAFSSANLILYLIEKNISREAAIYCSKIFQVDVGRQSQSPFIIFQGQKDHEDEGIQNAQSYIEGNFAQRITLNELSEEFGIGRRTLERRFKKATGNTVIEYIQRVKVEAAKRELEKGHKTVAEVMYEVGYSDSKAFREVFRKYAGLTPADYRDRFLKQAMSATDGGGY